MKKRVLYSKFSFIIKVGLLALFFLLLFQNSFTQILVPLNNEVNRRVEQYLYENNKPFFSILKPYFDTQLRNNLNEESTSVTLYDSVLVLTELKGTNKGWLKRKLFRESFIQIDSSEFYLFADPVFDFTYGKESSGKVNWANIRGFSTGIQIGNKFAFHSDFYENMTSYSTLIERQLKGKLIAPGEGRIHAYGGKNWDVSNATGYFSFMVKNKLNLQLGNGKNFIGDGYRSLLLSDISFNYPYFKTTWFGKNIMYAWMVGLTQNMEIKRLPHDREPFYSKAITMHLLSFNFLKKAQISLIKCEIFDSPDSLNKLTEGYKIFTPLPLSYKDSKSEKNIYGINLKLCIAKGFVVYNQYSFDKGFAGIQAGAKYFNAFSIRNLYLQIEYNQVDSNVYKSTNISTRWMHFGEPLAHPLGNNFKEYYLNMDYSWRRWQLNTQITTASALDGNKGVKSGIMDVPGMSSGTKMFHQNTEVRLYINPKTLAHLFAGYTYHRETVPGLPDFTMNYVYFGMRTMLKNFYSNY